MQQFRSTWAALGVALLSLGAALPADDAAETEAAAQLAKAEEMVAKGRHDKAVSLYKKIAKKFPDTKAGRAATRRTDANALIGWKDVLRNGPSENRVDLVIMGDGYLLKKQSAFDKLAEDVPKSLVRDPFFKEYEPYFNVIRANVVSEEDGIDGYNREASTALGSRLLASKNGDGRVAVDSGSVRGVISELPDEDGCAIVLVPRGSSGTGTEGVACVAGQPEPQLLRAFGQAFGGLYDETDQEDGLRRGAIPNARNIASTEDEERVPWAHFIKAKVSGVGVYRGGYGTLNGAWRPTASGCLMGAGQFFCPVCREILMLRMYDLVDPIDEFEPAVEEPLTGEGPHLFEVQTLKPAKHILEARWWVVPEEEAPPTVRLDLPRRSNRGALGVIPTDPLVESKRSKKGEHEFTFDPDDYEPGRYRVICRVRDTAKLRGQKKPWVLRDDLDLLVSERSWLVVVE